MSSFGYNVLGFGANANSVVLPSDDEFNRVSFLSHFDGSNSGVNNAFDDGSASNHTITANGNVTQGSFGPFAREEGYWGVDFSGTAGDYINYASSADWSPATGDFTVEFWINPRAWDQAYMPVFVVDYSGSNSTSGLFIGMGSNSGTKKFVVNGYADADIIGYATLPALNTWTHILVSRSGTSLKLFYDGVAVATATSSYNFGQSDLTIGSYGNYSRYLNATISNLHYVKGTATQTSDFTPPTGPSTAVTNTKLLACQSNRFVDNSASPHASTVAGNVAVTAFGPFLTSEVYDPAVNGASAYFDGSDDFLSFSHASDFAFGTGDFTIEWWSWGGTGTGNAEYIYQGTSASQQYHQLIESHSTGYLRYYPTAGSNPMHDTGWGAIVQNAWTHYAVARTSGTTNLYKNGVRVLTASGSPSNSNIQTITARIGASTDGTTTGSPWLGYITDFRIVKGTGVYTGTTYTVPTAPLTAITNTKLLLNMQDGQAIDSAAQNNLTLYGNTKLSTTQAKFGDTSMYFDGTDDFAILNNSEQEGNLGSGDWTIEGWLFITANAGTSNDEFAVASKWGGGSTRSWLARIVNGNKLTFWYINTSGTQVELTSDSRVLSLNTWYHVAWVKNSNLKVYLNGTAATLASSDFQIRSGTDAVQLSGRGGADGDDNMYQGYIDDFRISKFARYTNNFTAPTAPFADKGQ